MLDALQFVKRGVARRDFVPGLTHFRIEAGRVTGYNGTIAISAPINIGFDVAPEAEFFIRALNACSDVIALTMDTPTQLLVRSGTFRVSIPCIPLESVPKIVPEGETLAPHRSLLSAFNALHPFIGVDASRPWCMGILLAGQSAYATNNVIVTEYWLQSDFPTVANIPSGAIDEIIRVDEEMSHIQANESSITFHYADGRWIKSPVLDLGWPNIPSLMGKCWRPDGLTVVTDGLREACEKLAAFTEKEKPYIYFRGSDISTHRQGLNGGGAQFDLPGLPEIGCYSVEHLNTVLASASAIDFTRYPEAISFIAGNLRGLMLGVRS